MAGKFNLGKDHGYTRFNQGKTASNSLNIECGDALFLDTDGFLYKADAGETIEGVSVTKKTFSATNQTVEHQKVLYIPATLKDTTYKLKSDGAVFTVGMEGSFFDLTTAQLVDFSTASATTGQVRLEEICSNPLYALFTIANA